MKKTIIPYIIIFNLSGLIYVILECLWRGHSHWTMYVCAGICGLFIAGLNNHFFEFDTDFRIQVITATLFCTLAEFVFGLMFNSDFTIWDYRGLWGTLEFTNYQVNVLFIGVWFLICLFALPFLDWVEWKLGIAGEPYYRIGRKIWRPWGGKE